MSLTSFFGLITGIINGILVPLLFTVTFLVFIWGMFTYFIAAGESDEQREKGKKLALYGVIGFFLMAAVWGIVRVVNGTFGFDAAARPDLPTLGGSNNNQGNGGGGGLPNGAICQGADAECSSGECDWNGQRDQSGRQIFVCVAQRGR
jgi:hypothetical protein